VIATRYVLREVTQTLLVILGVLLILVSMNMFIHYLGVAAGGAMSGSDVLTLIGMTLPRYLALLIPVAFYLAIVFTAGKLFQDNELTVLFACGMGWTRWLRAFLMPTLCLSMIVGGISLVVMPKMSEHLTQLTTQAASQSDLGLIQPGRFISIRNGSDVIYIGASNPRELSVEQIFAYHQQKDGQAELILAPIGFQRVDPITGLAYILLKNGHLYALPTPSKPYQRIDFSTYRLALNTPPVLTSLTLDSQSSWSLMTSDKLHEKAEFQWRCALPLSVWVVMLMGIAICPIRPRQSRYLKIVPAILWFMLYFNTLSIARNAIDAGTFPPYLGLWSIHLLFGLSALCVILWREGGFQKRLTHAFTAPHAQG
jgi:lipopolysaccharide export system permease protein